MKKTLILIFTLLVGFVANINAQQDCGMISTPDPNFNQNHFRNYLLQKATQSRMVDDVPVQIHIVRTSAGNTSLSDQTVLDELGLANTHFAGTDINFVLCGDINYVDNDEFVSIDSYSEMDDLDAQERVEDVINIYFVSYANGSCGAANYPWYTRTWIMMKNSCSSNGSTLTHELGHYFGLYHTHSTSNGAELVDGSNCSVAGDLLCDTPADPNLSGNVNTNCEYFGIALDANGDAYTPDPSNLMSYSQKFCRDYFSPEQNVRMDYYNNNGRENLLCPPPSSCPNDIAGYTALGEFNNSKYYLSDNSATWANAQTAAASITDGHLIAINDLAENDFIEGVVGNKIYFIGLSDASSEGNLTWDSGETVNFDNSSGNNSNNDYGVFYFWDGSWGFEGANVWRKYIVEVPCSSNPGGALTVDFCSDDTEIGYPFNVSGLRTISFAEPMASTTCPDGIVSIVQTNGPQSGTAVPIDSYTITYEITDNCGNTATCSFQVTFVLIPPNINFQCPDNIQITVAEGETGATVTWDENDFTVGPPCVINVLNQIAGPNNGSTFPLGTTTVTYEANGNCYAYGYLETCSFDVTITEENSGGPCPEDIAGFTVLGEFGSSKYYLSDNSATWTDAQANAAANGGYLVSINNPDENDAIEGMIDNKIYFIGLNDAQNEGLLQWDSGQNVLYNNSSGNNDNNDYGVFYFWDGTWGFDGGNVWRKYIMEVSCTGVSPYMTVDCSGDILLPVPAGANEVVLDFDIPTATTTCLGGAIELTQVTGPTPGDIGLPGGSYFLQYILEDECGNFEYCEFYVRVEDEGSFVGNLECPEDIMQTTSEGSSGKIINWSLPTATYSCGTLISTTQVGGPTNGSLLPIGTSIISYSAIVNCNGVNYELTCDFTVTISEETTGACPPSIPGYTALGEFNNSKYFLSNNSSTWPVAQSNASNTNGGYLVSINDAAENDFLLSVVGSKSYFIGLSDAANEGSLTWDSGEPVNYDRSSGNSGSADYAVLLFWDGSWGFQNAEVWKKSILEVPCNGGPSNGPDLQVSGIEGLQNAGVQEEVVGFNFDLENTGNEVALGAYVIGAFLSEDATFSADDVQAGVVNTGNTPVGTIYDVPSAITVPSDLAPGDYYLILVADINGDIVELQEGNNEATSNNTLEVISSSAYTKQRGEVIKGTGKNIKVYPNPVMDNLNVEVVMDKTQSDVLLQVFDSRGTLQFVQQVDLVEGINLISLETLNLHGGMYYLLFPELSTKKYSIQFVKVRD